MCIVCLVSDEPLWPALLLKRRPWTGRPHQIRKHLAWAGHPIANDWLYGGRLSAAQSSLPTGRASVPRPTADVHVEVAGGEVMPTRMHSLSKSDEVARMVSAVQVDASHLDEDCRHCPNIIPYGWPTDLKALWLHARTYSSSEFTFTSPLPEWAHDTWLQL